MKIEVRIEPPRFLRGPREAVVGVRGGVGGVLDSNLEAQRPRWYRRRWGIALLTLAGALAIAVPVAWASDVFADVDTSNPFHNDINAIKFAGITQGCGTNSSGQLIYCPTDNVTREAMAAFMHRGFSRAAFGPYTGTKVLSSSSNTNIETLTITAGGSAGGTQFVKVDAVYNLSTSSSTCPCQVQFFITKDSGGNLGPVQYAQVDQIASSGVGEDSGAATAVVAVPSGTTQTFRLWGRITGGSGTMNAWGQMSAVTAPFGSTGGSTLSVSSGQAPTGPAAPGR